MWHLIRRILYLTYIYSKIPGTYGYYSRNGNNLRQSKSQSQSSVAGFRSKPHHNIDYDPSDSDKDGPSYLEELALVEYFGNYLKELTVLDESSTAINDTAHQFTALFAVLIALARVVRNACADFDKVYHEMYLSTVYIYYEYGMNNAETVVRMVEDYIRKGYSHMPKLMKLKQEHCQNELFCSVSLDNEIKSSPLVYLKELETLDALARLARSYYPHIKMFNQVAEKGNMLPYLKYNKYGLKDYVMHVVNGVEHLSDEPVRCP